MTDYYFSSQYGNDGNSGTSVDSPWQSLSMIEQLSLEPGDRILLGRGSVFTQELKLNNDDDGTAEHPIVITAYGEGTDPLITGTSRYGISGIKSDYVIVEHIDIGLTAQAGLKGNDTNHWIVRHVDFMGSGGTEAQDSGINWYNSQGILVEHSTFSHTYGDNIYMREVSDIFIRHNTMIGVHGNKADNVQISGNNLLMSNNIFIAGLDETVEKGNVVFHGEGFYAHNNYLQGGGFGFSLSADYAIIADNIINDHNKYSWSMGIGLSDEKTGDLAQGMIITGNEISGSPFNISFFGGMEVVESSNVLEVQDLEIANNIFHDWGRAPVKFTGIEAFGAYHTNTYFSEVDPMLHSNPETFTDVSAMYQGDHLIGPFLPPVHTLTISASASLYDGAPLMQVYHNDTMVLQTAVTANRTQGEQAQFDLLLEGVQPEDQFKITFINDKFNATTWQDRNLYVNSVELDGHSLHLKEGDTSHKVRANKAGDEVAFFSNGWFSFTGEDVNATPLAPLPVSGVMGLADFLAQQGTADYSTDMAATSAIDMAIDDFSLAMGEFFA